MIKYIYFISYFLFLSFQSTGQIECLVAHYPLDNDATDISDNEFHGISHNTTLTEDRFGNQNGAFKFDGSSSYVELNNEVGNGIRTVSLWFKLDELIDSTISIPRSLFVRNTQSNDGEVVIMFNSFPAYGVGTCHFGRRVGSNVHVIKSDQNYWDLNEWHCLVVTIDDSEGMKMYIDNILQMSIDSSPEATDIRTESLSLGRWGNQDQRYFKGHLDDVRIYDCALNEDQIASICDVEITNSIQHSEPINIIISPNPTNHKLNIHSNLAGNLFVELYSIDGKKIIALKEVNNLIETSTLVNGIYIIKIYNSQKELIKVEKIIRQ